jgi:hypothetical protein
MQNTSLNQPNRLLQVTRRLAAALAYYLLDLAIYSWSFGVFGRGPAQHVWLSLPGSGIVDQKYEIEPSSAADSYSIQYVVVLAAHVSPFEPILVFVVRNHSARPAGGERSSGLTMSIG